MKRCTRCVLPETYPEIEFDESGVCNYCRTHQKITYKGEEELDSLIGPARQKAAKYDCVIGVSGGRDSAYALHYLSRVRGLRVLAYSVDNGFVPEVTKANVRRMTETLGVDLVCGQADFQMRCIRQNLAAWIKRPSRAMINSVCNGCQFGIRRALLEHAKTNGIPLVVLGGSPVELCYFKWGFFADNPIGRRFKNNRYLLLLGGLVYEMGSNPRYLAPTNTLVNAAEFLYCYNRSLVQGLLYPQQTVFDLYEYIPWDENDLISTIKNELGWVQNPDSASSWRSDCEINFLKNYLLRGSTGFTERDDILSVMIREGMITREEAMRRIEKENAIPDTLVGELLDKLGLQLADLNAALAKLRSQHGPVPDPAIKQPEERQPDAG